MISHPRRGMSPSFTLIEVLVSMMILSGVIVVLTSSWSGSLFAYRKSKTLNTAAFLLKKKMIEYEVKYKDKPIEEIPDKDDGGFDDYPTFKWSFESKNIEFPDLTSVLINSKSDEGGANELLIMVIRQMTEQFSKSIKEIKVTITTKMGKRELNYSASSYMVDYTKPMTLGAGMGGGAGGGTDGAAGGSSGGGGGGK